MKVTKKQWLWLGVVIAIFIAALVFAACMNNGFCWGLFTSLAIACAVAALYILFAWPAI